MTQRVNHFKTTPALAKAMSDLSNSVASASLEKSLRHLVDIRASQLNHCAFCLDMHIKQAAIDGEHELRLHHVAIWRESTEFSPRERACLAWTEALTTLGAHGVPDEVYERVRTQLSEKEISDLSFAVMAINGWNRLNVGFRTVPGSADKAYGLDKARFN